MADTKNHSAKDVLELWATGTGKQPTDFGYQSFKNVKGTYSVALVNIPSDSLVVQANADDEQACFNKLFEASEAGIVTHVDEYCEPENNPTTGREVAPGYGAAVTHLYDGGTLPAFDDPINHPMTADDAWKKLPRNDKGQVVINENGFVEGTESDGQNATAVSPDAKSEMADRQTKPSDKKS